MKRVLTMVLLAICFWWLLDSARDCDLCRENACHAPCLVNLKTGEYAELVVYDEAYRDLYGKEDEGIFYYLQRAGAQSFLDTLSESNTAYLDQEETVVNPLAFCRECRKRLYAFHSDGYVLANCYENEPMIFYPIIDSVVYHIRCYTVTIKKDDDFGKTEIVVAGSVDLQNLWQE